jgi:hypothetical protein
VAVGKASSAVDNQQQYRPQESPANSNIQDRAGDAGGTLRGSSGKTNAVVFSEGQPHRVEVLKAASSAFVAEEQALADVGPDQGTASFQNGFYAHRGQSDRASGSRPGCELLLPLPQLVCFRRALGRELRRNESRGYRTESPGAPPWQFGHLR